MEGAVGSATNSTDTGAEGPVFSVLHSSKSKTPEPEFEVENENVGEVRLGSSASALFFSGVGFACVHKLVDWFFSSYYIYPLCHVCPLSRVTKLSSTYVCVSPKGGRGIFDVPLS